MDVQSPYEHEILDLIRGIEYFGDTELTKEIIQLFFDYYEKQISKNFF